MGETTAIEWADATINPWWGCTRVSPGCANCYAADLSHRYGVSEWGPRSPRAPRKHWRRIALRLERQAVREGRRLRVFCLSMGDWLDPEVPAGLLFDLLAVVASTPSLDWLLLSKRPEHFRARLVESMDAASRSGGWGRGWFDQVEMWLGGYPPENVWVGVSVEDQRRADERIPRLLEIPARLRFLSCEPLLGPVDLSAWIGYNPPHDLNREDRGVRIPGRSRRGAGDNRVRGGVANLPAQEGGPVDFERIPHGEDHEEREAGNNDGASPRVSPLFRTNPARADDQPQEWRSERQPPGELGGGNVCATNTPLQRSSVAPREGTGRREERHGEAHGESGPGDQAAQSSRRTSEVDSGRLRRERQDGFEDRSRGEMAIGLVICGGESGQKARPMHPDWARSLRDQCQAAGVPFHFKQWGEWRPKLVSIAGEPRPVCRGNGWGTLARNGSWHRTATPWNGHEDGDSPDGEVVMVATGKKAAGRLLDGRTWDETP